MPDPLSFPLPWAQIGAKFSRRSFFWSFLTEADVVMAATHRTLPFRTNVMDVECLLKPANGSTNELYVAGAMFALDGNKVDLTKSTGVGLFPVQYLHRPLVVCIAFLCTSSAPAHILTVVER